MRPSLKDIIERLRHANMAHGGLDVEKLPDRSIRGDRSSDDRALASGGNREVPSGVVMRGERPSAPAL